MDPYVPGYSGEDMFLPAAEAFPEMIRASPMGAGPRPSPFAHPEEQSSENREAGLRRKPRAPKLLPRDDITELRNADLARWNDTYVENMISEARLKLQHKASRLSKRNARLLVHGSGIGGVGLRFSTINVPGPLEIFSGDNLLEALTGEKRIAGTKRLYGEDHPDFESEGRRVRARDSDGDQIGRGNEVTLNNDEGLAVLPGEVN